MLNFNEQDKGYKDGLKQAREGKRKHYFSFNKLKAFFSSHALDTYIDGVNKGYLDGLREQNVKAFLQQFIDNLQTSSERYQRFIDDLADQQLDAQIYERYQAEFLDETKSRIQQIIENIESGDIPYIERLIRHLEETQAAAMG